MAGMFAKACCTYCQEDIAGLRVKCVECPDFELCLQCFSAGAEIGPHRNDHSYQFVNVGVVGTSFGKNGWSAREELHLLDAVEVFGFGNWEDVSQQIKTRTPEEAKEQYISRHLEGTIGRLTWPPALSLRPNLTDAANLDTGPLSPTSSGRLPPLDVTPEEAKQLGYMPMRDDFEREFDNEAEALLSPLCINGPDDDDLDVALTLVQVDIYTHRLRERARRKRVARDYQLVSQFYNSTSRKDKVVQKKKPTREEREFQEGLRVFSQFHTAQEHEQFVQNMQREQELKTRLSELSRYRQYGITRHEECAHFEQELFFRQELSRENPQSLGSSGACTPLPPFHPLVSTYLRKRERSEELVSCSTERRSTLGSLGSQFLDKVDVLGGCDGDLNGISGRQLSRQESNLCASLAITPAEYISIKAVLLKEPVEIGEEGQSPGTGVENRIRSYLVTQGWLSA